MTKSDIVAELQQMGKKPEVIEAFIADISDLPEQLDASHLAKIDAVLAELQMAELTEAHVYDQLSTMYADNADKMMDIVDAHVSDVAQQTVTDIKHAEALLQAATPAGASAV